jgi:2,5-diamino-6-hydroxy-4-(5-phosphoribosylamino)pyrimidine 1'-reductase
MSLDGKTASVGNDSAFSSDSDWRRVHALRNSVDGICVGIGTVLSDDPKLRVKFIEKKKNPHRIVIDSNLRIPIDAELLHIERDDVKVYIGTTFHATKSKVDKLKELKLLGVDTIACGEDTLVDVKKMWYQLKQKGINAILLEGGGTIAASMFDAGLIDEVRVFIAPVLLGGKIPPSVAIIMGKGFEKVNDGVALNLVNVKKMDGGIFARFLVEKKKA